MSLKPVEDIPDIEKTSIDVVKTDAYMRGVARSINIDLKRAKLHPDVRHILKDQINLFLTTHSSIRELIKVAIRRDQPPMLGDALSLTREQIEKLYTIALFIEDPERWLKQYLRNKWRKDYERYLLSVAEHKDSERFQEYLYVHFPEGLEKARKIKKFQAKGDEIIVSKLAESMTRYNFNNPGIPKNDPATKKRQWPKYFDREKLDNYFEFPTPGKSIRKIKSSRTRSLLYRWHKDYQYLSSYSHITMGKMILQSIGDFKNLYLAEKGEIYSEKERGYALFVSYTAFACACTLVSETFTEHSGGTYQLNKFWETLRNSSLLSRAYWNIYAIDVLK